MKWRKKIAFYQAVNCPSFYSLCMSSIICALVLFCLYLAVVCFGSVWHSIPCRLMSKTIDFTDYLQLNLIAVFRYVILFILHFVQCPMREHQFFHSIFNWLLLLLWAVSVDTIQVGDDDDDDNSTIQIVFFVLSLFDLIFVEIVFACTK